MDSDNNETLFYKVFNNKYLNKKIFQMISSEEWNQSKEYQSIYENRIKFKYIYNVNWMINNNLFQLLKYKLLNNQEYLEIKLNCFNSLFSIDLSTTTTSETINIELYKEIIQLLLKRRDKESLKIDDILESVITYGTLQIINIFFECLNQVHSTTTSTSTTTPTTTEISFKSIILNSFYSGYRFYQIKSYIQTNKVEPQVLKDFRFNLILSNLHLQSEIKQSDHQLLSSFGKSNLLQTIHKRSEVVLYLDEMVEFIKSLIFGKQNTTINNMVKIDKLLLCIKLYKIEKDITVIDQLQVQRQQQELDQDEEITIKELVGKFIILSESIELFKEYLVKYNQVTIEMAGINSFYGIALEYSLSNYISDILKCLPLNSNFSGYLQFVNLHYHDPLIFINKERSIEFLKVYLAKLKEYLTTTTTTTTTTMDIDTKSKIELYTIKLIFKVVFSINDKEQYQNLYNNHLLDYNGYLPNTWNSMIGKLNENIQFVMVKDIETINWIKEWFLKRLEFDSVLLKDSTTWFTFDFYIYRSLDFNTIELANYAKNQLPSSLVNQLSLQTIYYTIFIKSIVQGNLNNIKLIHSMNISYNDMGIGDHILNSMISLINESSSYSLPTPQQLNYQEFNELINFIFENQMVSIQTLYSIIKLITLNGYYDDDYDDGNNDEKDVIVSGTIKYNLSKLKFNFNGRGNEEIQQTILNSFYHYDKFENYNFVKFILDNIKFTIIQYNNSQNIQIKDYSLQKRKDKIVSLINLFINQIKQCNEIISYSTPLPNLKIYYEIISKLFNCLLLDDNIEIHKVDQLYQLLIENNIDLDIGKNVKLYYIKNKSMKLYNYSKHGLLNSPNPLPSPTIEMLSLEFIKNSTIDRLMDSIIYRPYLLYNDDNKIDFNDDKVTVKDDNDKVINVKIVYPVIINYNLSFYLYINRNDLFIKEWDFLVTTCKLKQLPEIKLIRLCCINLELKSINNILNVINDNYKQNKMENQIQLLQFCTISLKLGRFDISKLSFKLLIENCRSDYPQLINKIENYFQFDLIKNRESLIIELDRIIDK